MSLVETRVKILNKHLMMVEQVYREEGRPDRHSRTAEPNIFEATKAYRIAAARGAVVELPYLHSFGTHPRFPDLEHWYLAFTSDNHPQ